MVSACSSKHLLQNLCRIPLDALRTALVSIKWLSGPPRACPSAGARDSDARLLGYGYAYQQATQARLKRQTLEHLRPRTQLEDML